MSNSAIADVGDFSMQESVAHEFSFCDDGACSMSSGMSCFQHCDHQSVIPFVLPAVPDIVRNSEVVVIYNPFVLNLILRVELKPPQHSILEIV